MIIKDLLSRFSIEEIADAIMKIGNIEEKRRKNVVSVYEKLIRELQAIEPVVTEAEYGVKIIAWVLWDMAFLGITEEQVQKERDELTARIAEIKEFDKLPPEEREKHFFSAEELFEELGFHDDRTPAEKTADEQRPKRETMFNAKQKYTALKEFTDRRYA